MQIAEKLRELLHQPLKVLMMAAIVSVAALLYDGSFWNLWSLNRNHREMQKRIVELKGANESLHFRVEAAKSAPFIEKQATEQLGLVREDDLIFVFSDGE